MRKESEKTRRIVGENLRFLRLEYGLSIEYLAERLDLSPAFVGLVERGQRGMGIDNLIKLCKIFSISLDDLFFDETKEIYYKTKEEEKIDEIHILIQDLKFEKLNFLIIIIYGLRKL